MTTATRLKTQRVDLSKVHFRRLLAEIRRREEPPPEEMPPPTDKKPRHTSLADHPSLAPRAMELCGDAFHIHPAEMLRQNRRAPVARSRHAVCYVLMRFKVTSTGVGRFLDRDHAAVLNSQTKMRILRNESDDIRELTDAIIERLAEELPSIEVKPEP